MAMNDVARVIHLEVSFGASVPADVVNSIKDALHEEAKKLTKGIRVEPVMSLVAVAEEKTNHIERHLADA